MTVDRFLVFAIMGAFLTGFGVGYFLSIFPVIIEVKKSSVQEAVDAYMEELLTAEGDEEVEDAGNDSPVQDSPSTRDPVENVESSTKAQDSEEKETDA